jgi:HK97 family phage prohead protease
MSKKDKGNALPDNCERRVIAIDDMELRVADNADGPTTITGYAARFNSWSVDLGGFTEKIKPGAFDEALDRSDVRALKNHDPNLLLGRTSAETLRLKTNTVGLQMEIDIPETTAGRDTAEEIRRKDITGCSFSFTTAEDDWKYNEDGTVQRTIVKVGELFDVGPVTFPAYPDTSVAARSLDAFRESQDRQTNERGVSPDQPGVDCPLCDSPDPEYIDDDRQRQIGRAYRKLGRFLKRFRSAES